LFASVARLALHQRPLYVQSSILPARARSLRVAIGIRARFLILFDILHTERNPSMRSLSSHLHSALTLASVCAVVCAASVHAQTWSTPHLVENGGGAAVSANSNGTAAVIFAGLASVKTGGTWGAPISLASGSPASDIKVAPNGDVLAIWSFRTSNTYLPVEAQAAFFSGGRWGPTWTITTNEFGDVYNFGPPSIAFDGNSQATVVWEEYNGSTCSVLAITGNAAAGFGSRQTVSNEATCEGRTQLAVNHSGKP